MTSLLQVYVLKEEIRGKLEILSVEKKVRHCRGHGEKRDSCE